MLGRGVVGDEAGADAEVGGFGGAFGGFGEGEAHVLLVGEGLVVGFGRGGSWGGEGHCEVGFGLNHKV